MDRFQDFWPYYLQEHKNPICRALHYCGTSLGLLFIAVAIWQKSLGLFLLAPIVGYAFSWVGHFAFEKNRPATFKHPFLSFRGDFRMLRYWFTGRIKGEIKRVEGLDSTGSRRFAVDA